MPLSSEIIFDLQSLELNFDRTIIVSHVFKSSYLRKINFNVEWDHNLLNGNTIFCHFLWRKIWNYWQKKIICDSCTFFLRFSNSHFHHKLGKEIFLTNWKFISTHFKEKNMTQGGWESCMICLYKSFVTNAQRSIKEGECQIY